MKLLLDQQDRYIVLDVVRLRGSPHEVEDAIVKTAQQDGRTVVVSLPEDPGQAGKSQVTYLTRRLAGHQVHSSRESGAKAVRATATASQIEAGNMSIVKGDWNKNFLDELRDFPWGRKDDQVDALVRAFTYLSERPKRRTNSGISIFNR